MKTSSGLIVALALFAMPATAQEAAVCPAPELPAVERPVKPVRPAVPNCVDEARHRHTCSNRVIGQYNAALDAYGASFTAYVAAVNAYARKLAAYVQGVNGYVQCEQNVVMPSTLIEGWRPSRAHEPLFVDGLHPVVVSDVRPPGRSASGPADKT